jgi:hypothetical protein
MKDKNGEKIKHGAKRFRLSDELSDKLKKHKPRGLSWNLFFKELLNKWLK